MSEEPNSPPTLSELGNKMSEFSQHMMEFQQALNMLLVTAAATADQEEEEEPPRINTPPGP